MGANKYQDLFQEEFPKQTVEKQQIETFKKKIEVLLENDIKMQKKAALFLSNLINENDSA